MNAQENIIKRKIILAFLMLLIFSVVISVVYNIAAFNIAYNEIQNKISKARISVFNSKTLYQIDIRRYPIIYNSYFKNKKKYPQLFTNITFFNQQFKKQSNYALFILRKSIRYSNILTFQESPQKITTVYYNVANKLIYVEICNINLSDYISTSYTYDDQGRLVYSTFNTIGGSMNWYSYLFTQNKELLNNCCNEICSVNEESIKYWIKDYIVWTLIIAFVVFGGLTLFTTMIVAMLLFIKSFKKSDNF